MYGGITARLNCCGARTWLTPGNVKLNASLLEGGNEEDSGEDAFGTVLRGEEGLGRDNVGGNRKPPVRTCMPGRRGGNFIGASSGIAVIFRLSGMVGKYPPPVPSGKERNGVIDTPPRAEGGPLNGVAGMDTGVWKAVCGWKGVIGTADGRGRTGVRMGSLSTFIPPSSGTEVDCDADADAEPDSLSETSFTLSRLGPGCDPW